MANRFAEEPEKAEEVRVCSECLAVVSAAAKFCEACGKAINLTSSSLSASSTSMVTAAGDPSSVVRHVEKLESRETAKLARELFKRHLALIAQVRAEIAKLREDVNDVAERIDSAGRSRLSSERSEALQVALEDLEVLGDSWEEMQHRFNRDSEDLDQEILDRAAELEMDVELPPELRLRVEEGLNQVGADMQMISDSVARQGAMGQRFLKGPTGRWFDSFHAPVTGLGFWALVILAGAAAYGLGHQAGIDAKSLAQAVLAPWLGFSGGLLALGFWARRERD